MSKSGRFLIDKKRNTIFLIVGLTFLTLSILFGQKFLVGLGGAMVGIPLAHVGAPYRSNAHHFFVFVISLAAVLFYIFSMTFLWWGRISIP